MLIDSRLKPELVAAKAPPAAKAGEPVEHAPMEMVFVYRGLPGVTPREVGPDELPGLVFATDGRAAVAVPVTLCRRYDHGDDEPPVEDCLGSLIPAALAHARKNLVAPKTASLELHFGETITPDGATFPRLLPGTDKPAGTVTGEPDTAKPKPIDTLLAGAGGLFGLLGMTEATASISVCPFRLLAIAKAMGVGAGDGVTLLFRGQTGVMTVLPLHTDACFTGEAVGLLMPICPDPKKAEASDA